jgi:hypothetical protein
VAAVIPEAVPAAAVVLAAVPAEAVVPAAAVVLAAAGFRWLLALRGYGVDASAMSFWLHDRGIHIVWARQDSILVMPV